MPLYLRFLLSTLAVLGSTKADEQILPYSAFGPQAASWKLIGKDWWQWESHGDSKPRDYPIKVVVYWNQSLETTEGNHPVNEDKEQDFRYLEYSKAIRHLESLIKNWKELNWDPSEFETTLAALKTSHQPLHQDTFSTDLSQWVVEQASGGTVALKDGRLDINDAKGCTVWFKEKLTGPITIEFKATLIKDGGKHDRVSDLNCFWMATDPKHPENIFNDKTRGGLFKNYDALRLYYVGYGANKNTTTRFRRYVGDGSRPCLPEHDLRDAKFLHTPNKTIHIRIIADGEKIQYLRDGDLVFDFHDKNPYTEGWFGFRTVNNHLWIDDFKVYGGVTR